MIRKDGGPYTASPPWNAINIIGLAVILINYFDIYYHSWFVSLTGGFIFKLWIFPFLLMSFIFFQLVLQGREITIRKDNLTAVKLFGALYFLFGLNSLIIHDQGIWYIGKYALFMFMPLVLFSIIIARFRSNKNINTIMIALFIGGLIMSLYVEALYATGNLDLQSLSTDGADTALSGVSMVYYASEFGMGAVRRGFPGVGINAFSKLLVPLLFVGLYMAYRVRGISKLFYSIATIFIFYSITTTLSRAALISVAIGLIVFIWYHRNLRLLFYFLIMALIVVYWKRVLLIRFLTLVAAFSLLSGSEQVAEQMQGMHLTDSHITSLSETISVFLENPVYGAGMSEMQKIHEHNRYMEVLGTHGLAGFIPYVGLIISIVLVSRKRVRTEIKKNSRQKDLGIALYSGLIALIVYLNAEPSETYFFWIWFGLITAWARNCYFCQENKDALYCKPGSA